MSRPLALPSRHRWAALALALCAATPALAESWARLDPAQGKAARAAGVAVVEDYGSFLWVRGPVDRLARLGASDAADTLNTFGLDLARQRFDPLATYPDSLAQIAGQTTPQLHLVQFRGPLRQAWLDRLAQQNLAAVQYLGDYTYVVWGSGQNLAAAARSSEVRWAGEFSRDWRHNGLSGFQRRVDARVWLYRPALVEEANLRIAGAEVYDRATIDANFDEVRVRLDAATLDNLLLIPGVYAVSPLRRSGGLRGEVGDAISMNMFNGAGVPQPGYRARLTQIGVDGTGVTLADVDSGVYDANPSLVARMLPCVGSTCGNAAGSGHGTHTAAIMAGDGGPGTAANGFQRGLGMAPGARLIEQLYSPTFTQAGGMLTLMTQSYANGAVLSGNSWGPEGSPAGYDSDTRQVDVGARDTNPALAGDQPLIYVLSIMNGYGGVSSQGTPDEAKNVITVGSTWGESAAGVPESAAQLGSLSTNSGHGPALDTRRIPHLVAPGCDIDSAISAAGYGLNCGTSMASPHVAGAVGLFVQKYRNENGGTTPSPALAKAALLAGTQDLFGGNDADGLALTRRPNNQQGWGRLRTDRLLAQDATVWYYDQQTVLDNTGQVWTQDLRVVDPSKPVQVMLVYTDAPGHGLGGNQAAWNNDLDLVVFSDKVRYRGNVFGADGWSTTGGTADAKNNAEGVMLAPAQINQTLRLQVTAANINSDARPNSGDATEQDFAIVCRNCRVP